MDIKRFHGWLISQTDLPKLITLTDDGRSSNRQLVVDGWNMAYQLAQSDKTWTTGDTMFSNWNKVFAAVAKLAVSFRRFSIDLVFFLDAWYEPNKLSEKKSRIEQQMKNHQALVPLFQRSRKVHKVCNKCLDDLATGSFGWSFEFVHALRTAGCPAYFTRGDADIAIAQYVKSHQEVLGIFSTDTDLLAFNFASRVAVIRDLDSIQVESTRMKIRCLYPGDIWSRLGLSKPQKMRFIAFMGNDLVKGTVKNVRDAVFKARNRRFEVSQPIIDALTKTYQINSKSARKWNEQIGGRSKTEAFVMELNTNRRVKFQCEIGDDKVGAAPRLLRPLRQHLYHVLDIPRVEEVMFLPNANGETELVRARQSDEIGEIFDHILESKDPGLDDLISAACDVLRVISPYDDEKTRIFWQMLRAQYKIIAKFPTVFKKLKPKVQRFMKSHAPLAQHLTMAHMFKRIVLITHILVGRQETTSISEWFYPPLCHYGLQKIGELNDVLSEMDCDGLGPIAVIGSPRPNVISCVKKSSHPYNGLCITPSPARMTRTRASSGKKPGSRRRGRQASRRGNTRRSQMNRSVRLPRFPGEGSRSNRGGYARSCVSWDRDYDAYDLDEYQESDDEDYESNDEGYYEDIVFDAYERRNRKKLEARQSKQFMNTHF